MKYLEDKPFHVGDYKPNAEFCCIRCVFGFGLHADFCTAWRNWSPETPIMDVPERVLNKTCFCPIENHNDMPDGPRCFQCGGLIQK